MSVPVDLATLAATQDQMQTTLQQMQQTIADQATQLAALQALIQKLLAHVSI